MNGEVLRPRAFRVEDASPWAFNDSISSIHGQNESDAGVLVSQGGFRSSSDASAFAAHTRPPHIPCALDSEAFLKQISIW